MTLHVATGESSQARAQRRTADFLILTKPRVVLMVLVTTAVGFYLGSPGPVDALRLLHSLLGTALAAGGTIALNQFLERDGDTLMERTRHRPLPDRRMEPGQALCFGMGITAGGILYLARFVDALPALVTALTAGSYLFLYTPLKRKTTLCSMPGAVSGALPPVAGWVAARGEFGPGAWILFAILFLWQIPHSLAIAWIYRADYARAGIRLLPVIDPEGASAGWQVVNYSLALLTAGLFPTLIGLTGPLYFYGALVLGVGLLACGVVLAVSRSVADARRLLYASLVYLPVLLVLMALDKARF
ncbi:MAG TPA: heme o synthase [Candidatus Methylomirabilis sp.]|nr:heme o synthase [Candidatus Methylomirabilis sp.]